MIWKLRAQSKIRAWLLASKIALECKIAKNAEHEASLVMEFQAFVTDLQDLFKIKLNHRAQ